jgi:SAM-dependent methyltransferase
MSDDQTFPCRACGHPVDRTFVDLGSTPLANSYIDPRAVTEDERTYPLHVRVCENCWLVQLPAVVDAHDIFSDYAYFSSYSESWLAHAREFATQAIERWSLARESLVVEAASNDGYLLQFFRDRGVRVLGIEPAANVAATALGRGVPTEVCFLGRATARGIVDRAGPADLVAANNVLAHVPDLNDFVAGLATLLAPEGVLSIEFPHLLNLIREVQFDTIYHEHFSYFSLLSAEHVLSSHGLRVFDVEQLATHGGSLRVLACRDRASHVQQRGRDIVRELEREAGLDHVGGYAGYADAVTAAQRSLREFLAHTRADGATVVAYGAAAKGNTLLNSAGVGAGDIDYVVDRNPHKQGMLMPGSRLRIRAPEAVDETQPDYLLILPWNLAREITEQMAHVREWGCRFVVPVPVTQVLS